MSSSTGSFAPGLNGTLISIPGTQALQRAAWAVALVVVGVAVVALSAQVRITLPS